MAVGYVEIPLTKGFVAMIDLDDYQDISRFNWHAQINRNTVYALRSYKDENGVWRKELMHRRILKMVDRVDHRNHNGLDNRRTNLRQASKSQNQYNRSGRRKDNTSGFQGVSWNSRDLVWQAKAAADGVNYALGSYSSAEEAARAYDDFVSHRHGEFAYLNFTDR